MYDESTNPTEDEPEDEESESDARAAFIAEWSKREELRRAGVEPSAAAARTRTHSDVSSGSEDDHDSSTSPSRYSSRSKQARTVCCDCARNSTCGFTDNCACRNAGRVCTSCDPGVCRSCPNRHGRLPSRARTPSTRLADLARARELAVASARLPPAPAINTLPSGPNPGPGGQPTEATADGDSTDATPPNASTNTTNNNCHRWN